MVLPQTLGGFHVPDDRPADKAAVFKALCESRALRWRRKEWEWIGHAVDPLQQWAVENGLVRLIGQDAVQAIMAEAFDDRR
jgi:hypothetical protein